LGVAGEWWAAAIDADAGAMVVGRRERLGLWMVVAVV